MSSEGQYETKTIIISEANKDVFVLFNNYADKACGVIYHSVNQQKTFNGQRYVTLSPINFEKFTKGNFEQWRKIAVYEQDWKISCMEEA